MSAAPSIVTVAALYRHPVKGFTPEGLAEVMLTAGSWFPGDRMWAVENGPSGFDPAAPEHISKMRFTVLARQEALARIVTRWDEPSNRMAAWLEDRLVVVQMDDPDSRALFESALADFLGEEAQGPLRLIDAGPCHRFMDSHRGKVSVLNLASVRDLQARLGLTLDPLRFRANVWVEGWAPWIENDLSGAALMIGETVLLGDKPIVRCAATEVDPVTGVRDIEVVRALWDQYGHRLCGLYCSIQTGGRIVVGDPVARPA
ncbi:MOSC domain-containing protein [soil metagenome]